MSLREVVDSRGTSWVVFEVHPDPLSNAHPSSMSMDGWLCMYSDSERRIIRPIPNAWASLPDAALLELGESVTSTPRLLSALNSYDRRSDSRTQAVAEESATRTASTATKEGLPK